jgi:hypothetical protein
MLDLETIDLVRQAIEVGAPKYSMDGEQVVARRIRAGEGRLGSGHFINKASRQDLALSVGFEGFFFGLTENLLAEALSSINPASFNCFQTII